ncbi:MAG: glycosyltransferase [Tissierella sp.]|nr:glycosyltransferase [Tissierella sp.]
MSSIAPRVSIVIPVYNVEQYLRECLDSVINQTLKEIEIICVNDGSTDSSPEILKEYAEKDYRIKVISKPNSGYGHTMNVGLDAATGEYIGIVESDDYVKLDMYETLYNIAKRNNAEIVKADFYRFTKESGKLNLEYNKLTGIHEGYYGKIINPKHDTTVFLFIMNTWSGIYKREFLKKYSIRHNETPGASFQDNGFWFQTFCRADRVYFVDKPFYMNRRDNPNSSVHSKEKVFCMCDEYDYIKAFLESNPDLIEKFIIIYSLKRYHNYMFTYNRIADEFKPIFLKRFSCDFRKAMENRELDKSLFTPKEWKNIKLIIQAPDKFYIQSKIEAEKRANSKTFISKGLYYLKDNGIKQTLKRLKVEIKNKF